VACLTREENVLSTVTPDVEPEATPSAWREYRLWLVAGVVIVAALIGLAVVVLRGSGANTQAQRLAAIPTPAAYADFVRADVRQVSGTSILVAPPKGDVRQLNLGGTRVEALLPALPTAIALGDFISIGGAPNLVNSIAVKLVVVIPAAEAGDAAGGVPRSKGGFTGWEAYPSLSAPRLYGKVDSIGADGIHVSGAEGAFVVTIDPMAMIRRLMAGGAELVHGGDHVAFAAGAGQAPSVLLDLTQ
jgi:hypothetical protein